MVAVGGEASVPPRPAMAPGSAADGDLGDDALVDLPLLLRRVAAGGGGDARPVRGSNVGGGRSHGDGAFRAVRFVRCVYDMPVQSANGTPQNSAPLIALDQYLLPREARSTNPVGALSSL